MAMIIMIKRIYFERIFPTLLSTKSSYKLLNCPLLFNVFITSADIQSSRTITHNQHLTKPLLHKSVPLSALTSNTCQKALRLNCSLKDPFTHRFYILAHTASSIIYAPITSSCLKRCVNSCRKRPRNASLMLPPNQQKTAFEQAKHVFILTPTNQPSFFPCRSNKKLLFFSLC